MRIATLEVGVVEVHLVCFSGGTPMNGDLHVSGGVATGGNKKDLGKRWALSRVANELTEDSPLHNP